VKVKSKIVKLSITIITCLIALFTIGRAFAWFVSAQKNADFNFGGSSASAYFAGGNGSEENPFIINTSTHLYNLAWLQNTGKFIEEADGKEYTVKYYFALGSDINAAGIILPPVGTATYPFMGEFDGRGYKITNLCVSTNLGVLTEPMTCDKENRDIVFSSYVGMFGEISGSGANKRVDNTTESTTTYFPASASKVSLVTNFILSEPKVEVASTNTLDGGTVNVQYSDMGGGAAGFAIGKVEGEAHSIGVYGGTLAVRKSGYTTFNSIIGSVGKDVTTNITGGGYTTEGSEGNLFGSSFDVTKLSNRLSFIYNYGVSSYLPSVDYSGNSYTLGKTDYIPLTITNAVTSTFYSKTEAKEEVSASNTGYFIGNQNKVYNTNITFGNSGSNVPLALYKKTGTASTDIRELTDEEKAEISKNAPDILSLIPDAPSSKTFGTIRLQQKIQASNVISNATLEVGGVTYTNAIIPSDGIWFKPVVTGKIRIVIYASTDDTAISIYKFYRGGNLSSAFELDTPIDREVNMSIPGKKLFYLEYDVSKEDLANNVEYALGKDDKDVKGAYILYMDIGTSETGGSTQTGKVDKTFGVSAIDFIYDGVTLSDGSQSDNSGTAIEAGNFVVADSGYYASYTPTRTSVYFKDYSELLVLAFVRTVSGENVTFTVKTNTQANIDYILATDADKMTILADSQINFTFLSTT
jgi:hypothetical protein